MPMLDASTMVLVLALGNLTLCALLTFFNHGPVRAPAMTFWSLSKQIQGGAWLLLALGDSGVVPAPISIPGGYALLFAGVAIEAGASWEAARRPAWRTPT
ncbi:MAG: GGDEF domain-containing protein, partial [Massilia sp.]